MTWNRRRRIVVKRGMQLINGLWGENSRSISNWCLPISNDWGLQWAIIWSFGTRFLLRTDETFLLDFWRGRLSGSPRFGLYPLINSRSLNFIAFHICLRTCQKKARKKSTRKQIKNIILIFWFSAHFSEFWS